MKTTNVALAAVLAVTITIFEVNAETAPEHESLYNTVAALDAAVFDAFNHCSESGQLDKHASYFAADVEFYHDNGGVTWTREDMIAGTRKNVCGKFSRELVEGSLKVYPIKGFGAIAQGTHRFCQFSSGVCEGLADFTMIWHEQNGKWELTRVLSYGHRPASYP
ncbi:nuclear transport factor 2 family protein [Shewanella sp.]|uniref:nuclear transport factor 2 family protein n=1 Tax=Shewanella sp. TaxID=50422 RepID=UPI003A987939